MGFSFNRSVCVCLCVYVVCMVCVCICLYMCVVYVYGMCVCACVWCVCKPIQPHHCLHPSLKGLHDRFYSQSPFTALTAGPCPILQSKKAHLWTWNPTNFYSGKLYPEEFYPLPKKLCKHPAPCSACCSFSPELRQPLSCSFLLQ